MNTSVNRTFWVIERSTEFNMTNIFCTGAYIPECTEGQFIFNETNTWVNMIDR